MKAIILAAGQGTRLGTLTEHSPKTMVQYQGKCLIDHLLDTFASCGIEQPIVVTGYASSVLEAHLADRKVTFAHNPDFAATNMVATLFCALRDIPEGEDVIVSYSDIIYRPSVLKQLIASEEPLSCVVDLKWRDLWQQRMDDPLNDAETLKIDEKGNIIEVGKSPAATTRSKPNTSAFLRSLRAPCDASSTSTIHSTRPPTTRAKTFKTST